jgi:diaminohydroxyphosphoribosylaminopyrimidine deaminase/5-amino-6-(5-phosphoribosylamino)uracil reductase
MAVLSHLAECGVTRLLVEGGAGVHAAFLDRGLADRLEVFSSPMMLGDAGHSAIGALAALTLEEAPQFRRLESLRLGPDLLESFEIAA